jgi:hypothetical protein
LNLSRVDNKKLRQAVALATKKLEEAQALLETYLDVLPDDVRATVPRVRSDFPDAARALAKESAAHPDVVAATEYEAEAVLEVLITSMRSRISTPRSSACSR